jgi:hypothetical protein
MTQTTTKSPKPTFSQQVANPFANPFDAAGDPDRSEIWEALVRRDSDAFAAADWSVCAADFAADRFEGISAHGSLNPIEWSLRYPTIESYQDDWTRMAHDFLALPLARVSHRELLYRMQRIARIEITGTRAVVWKQFRADEALTTADRYTILAQSVYRLHKIDGRWRIVGFVGYLPLERE